MTNEERAEAFLAQWSLGSDEMVIMALAKMLDNAEKRGEETAWAAADNEVE